MVHPGRIELTNIANSLTISLCEAPKYFTQVLYVKAQDPMYGESMRLELTAPKT